MCDEDTKKKKDKARNQTVAKWVFAPTTHVVGSKCSFAWWMIFGGRFKVQVHQNRLSGFGVVRGQNLPISIDLAIGSYSSLYYQSLLTDSLKVYCSVFSNNSAH